MKDREKKKQEEERRSTESSVREHMEAMGGTWGSWQNYSKPIPKYAIVSYFNTMGWDIVAVNSTTTTPAARLQELLARFSLFLEERVQEMNTVDEGDTVYLHSGDKEYTKVTLRSFDDVEELS